MLLNAESGPGGVPIGLGVTLSATTRFYMNAWRGRSVVAESVTFSCTVPPRNSGPVPAPK